MLRGKQPLLDTFVLTASCYIPLGHHYDPPNLSCLCLSFPQINPPSDCSTDVDPSSISLNISQSHLLHRLGDCQRCFHASMQVHINGIRLHRPWPLSNSLPIRHCHAADTPHPPQWMWCISTQLQTHHRVLYRHPGVSSMW